MENRCARSTKKAMEFLKQVMKERDFPTLTSVLKFSIGHSFISSINDPKIKIEYLDESNVMLEAQTCFSLLYLPVNYEQYNDFTLHKK